MKLYKFDGIDEQLRLLPLAARRALDAIGQKLSLEGFLSLSLPERQALVQSGCAAAVDVEQASAAIAQARPPATQISPTREPDASSAPPLVTQTLGKERAPSDKLWQSLSALDRYSIVKVCARPRPDRIEAAYDEIIGQRSLSTHLRPQGGVHMVSVAEKQETLRSATAESRVAMSEEAFSCLSQRRSPKGDVLGTARLAGIMATKRTSDLIPLCHPLSLLHAEVDFEELADERALRISCQVQVWARTGVEMEAMVGASTAALTIYDMLKSKDRAMVVGPTRLVQKSGGRSGNFQPPA